MLKTPARGKGPRRMSITEELREYTSNLAGMLGASVTDVKSALEDIADRIDQEHDGEFFDMQREHDELVHDRDANYIPLPKDADEVPILVGDVVEWVDEPDVSRVVSSIHLAGDGWWVFVGGTGRRPDKHRHHHEPTVEDVLEEFFGKANLPDGTQTRAEIIAEYAAKLRLAGEDE